mgnify:CR=1 FL=1
MFSAFTALALLISCMGLWGLATFAAQQRTKEIGIRKVLGAGAAQLTIMLSGGFLKLVGIAFVAALPVAYGGIQYWLQGYAFRVHTQWWVFALAGAGAMLIAFVTISFQSIRAALANPVETLRSE